ncbi:MAG: ribonucleoside-diphosphate reductase subunit alpha [Deltaproteobacteria bacterium]|nr:ribonucleoside-diphosphate reductase subunit alpha [Deltaproteobacteria bacterium]
MSQHSPITAPATATDRRAALVQKPAQAGAVDPTIRVRKRDGHLETVDPLQIVLKVARAAEGLPNIDPQLVAEKAIRGLYDGVCTTELDSLLISNAAMLIAEEPEYSKLAARLLDVYIAKEVYIVRGIESFYDSIMAGYRAGIISPSTYEFVCRHAHTLNTAIQRKNSNHFEYFGLRTVYDRYLLRDPLSRHVIETPQYFFMRVACGLSTNVDEAIGFYNLISSFEYMPSTPTLFNSGTAHQQMSSCYLLDSPADDLGSIYDKYRDVAMLSKFAGGIGLAYHRVRSRGSLIRGTNGKSNGIVPFLKTLDSSVAAVNQGGKRKGAACIYLETWHADIMDFLQLRNNTGDEAQRTHNLNLANWIPDLFMKRLKTDRVWSLFDPCDVPHLTDLYGHEFEAAYEAAEASGLAKKQVKTRELYALMMKTLAQTGNGWITFKDASNLKSNQTGVGENVIHLSNLCTEILEVTSAQETAVCNLGSLNLARYVNNGAVNFDKLAQNVQLAVRYLDRVVDINFYPIAQAEASNHRWRPVGLGVMGLQDVFFRLGLPFDAPEARAISAKIQEVIYFNALKTSCELAREQGAHSNFAETRAAKGDLQFDLWGVTPTLPEWDELKAQIREYGLRNSLLVAVAPTATIASIVGSYECIEPQISNQFKRETLSGEFLQINSYLVDDLRKLGLWNKSIRAKIKLNEGSIQNIEEIPDDIKQIYRTVWEVPMRSLIDMAAERGPYIDQSQSLNLFMENPTIGKLSSMYAYAWERGLKTTYYLRSRAATKIEKTTVSNYTETEAIACSLENPEACEACQ